MPEIELEARAKINLSVDITRKRPDGYHEVCMIMQTIDLSDRVILDLTDGTTEVRSSSSEIPAGPENIAYKAAKLFFEETGIKRGAAIYIEKRIPVAAGLAGGSSNAAAVLAGLNGLCRAGISPDGLIELGKRIGADVPFCIAGGTALARGIGEKLTPLEPFSGIDLVLIKPEAKVSTSWAYRRLDAGSISSRPDTRLLVDAVNKKNINALAENMKNVLEEVTIPEFPQVAEAKRRLAGLGAAGSMMSGSGPSVFGIFSSRAAAENAFEAVKDDGKWDCFLCRTI